MKHKCGINRSQLPLFVDSIDDRIGQENVVRLIDLFVDGLDLCSLGFSGCVVKNTGRPPYSPFDLLKLYIYGYFNRIRSSRCLEREAARNVELIWLLRSLTPDFKTIADFRKDNAKALEKVFKNFVQLSRGLNLLGSELVSVDGSKFRAVNSSKMNTTKNKLEKSVAKDDVRIAKYLSMLDENDVSESSEPVMTAEEIKAKIALLQKRQQDRNEMLKTMKDKNETQISFVDPDSRLMKDKQGFSVSYNVQTSVESESKMIIDYKVTNDVNDTGLLSEMAIMSKETLGVENLDVVADTGYFKGCELSKCVDAGITPYVPEEDKTANDSKHPPEFRRDKFIFNAERNVYVCPCGFDLKQVGTENRKDKVNMIYRCSSFSECGKSGDCSSGRRRELYRSSFDDVIIDHRNRMSANPGKMKIRRTLSEHPFGTIKRSFGMGYLLVKGLEKTSGEMALICTVYNLKRAITMLGIGTIMKKMAEIMAKTGSQNPNQLLLCLFLCLIAIKPQKISHFGQADQTLASRGHKN